MKAPVAPCPGIAGRAHASFTWTCPCATLAHNSINPTINCLIRFPAFSFASTQF
jgi:hypothetical protein